MRFADIPGHDDVKNRLRDMVDSGRMPHALLLEGPEGTAKFMLARALSTYIHCTDRRDGDSCGVCDSCRQHASFNHIDTLLSFPVVKKNSKPTISDDYAADFHEFITEYPYMDINRWLKYLGNINAQPQIYVEEASHLIDRLNMTARRSRFKTVLMWQPERLHASAANKLLKLIEEPSDDTIFILSSDNAAEILPTIYSRTQRIKVRRYSDELVAAILVDSGFDPGQASVAAAMADGSVNKALRVADTGNDSGEQQMLDLFMALMRLAWKRQVSDLRVWSNKVAELGREGVVRFFTYCARMIRDNFILNLHDNRLVTMTADEYNFSARFSPYINERNIEAMLAEFDRAASDIAANCNARIVAFDLAVLMIQLLRK